MKNALLLRLVCFTFLAGSGPIAAVSQEIGVKEVWENDTSKIYPSYLLVSYEGKRYRIVGESDYATDRVLGYNLEIGEPIEFERAQMESDSTYHSVAVMASDPSFGSEMDTAIASIDSLLKPLDPIAIFPGLSSMGAITVSKGYVFLLVGFLAIGGLMIFIADSLQSRKRKEGAIKKRHKKVRVTHGYEIQSVFESFVMTLFDPLYFRQRKPKRQAVLAGNFPEAEGATHLDIEFNYKETQARFAIQCQYFKSVEIGEIQLFSPARYQRYKDFEKESGMPFYFILGFGGTADDPKELFLVPGSAINGDVIHKDDVKPHSKSGMFFYNRVAGRLQ